MSAPPEAEHLLEKIRLYHLQFWRESVRIAETIRINGPTYISDGRKQHRETLSSIHLSHLVTCNHGDYKLVLPEDEEEDCFGFISPGFNKWAYSSKQCLYLASGELRCSSLSAGSIIRPGDKECESLMRRGFVFQKSLEDFYELTVSLTLEQFLTSLGANTKVTG